MSGVGTSFKAGDHCKFCPALQTCQHVQDQRSEAAKRAFDDDDLTTLTPDQISADLTQADVLEEWIKRIREVAYSKAIEGVAIPGFKLVAKRATRSWKDEDVTASVLNAALVDKTVWLAPGEVKSPAQVLGSRRIKSDPALLKKLSALVRSESSGTALAPDSDPREAVKPRVSAADAFDLV
ncbi:MAG: DUF2800 domain-containing protein [Devosia sp.]|nr:DUF2800 domain-containing protein [Devosia sp.]